jgi:hypothetical protein
MTVDELGERMSSDELTHWAAFFKLEHEDAEQMKKSKKPGGDE